MLCRFDAYRGSQTEKDDIMSILKPCPCCAGEAKFVHAHTGIYKHRVECMKCGLRTEGSVFRNDDYNADKWNRRASYQEQLETRRTGINQFDFEA